MMGANRGAGSFNLSEQKNSTTVIGRVRVAQSFCDIVWTVNDIFVVFVSVIVFSGFSLYLSFLNVSLVSFNSFSQFSVFFFLLLKKSKNKTIHCNNSI